MRFLKQPLILFLLLIVIVLIGWLLFQSDNENVKIGLQTEQVTYKSQQMLTTVYDPTGKLSYKLVSEQVEHYATQEETWFTKPLMTLFDQNSDPSWRIRANSAKLTVDKMLYLYGNVEVDSLANDSQIEKIKTENAQINLITQDILSDDEVTIYGDAFTTSGLKLRGNLRTKTANLLDKVNTYYGKTN